MIASRVLVLAFGGAVLLACSIDAVDTASERIGTTSSALVISGLYGTGVDNNGAPLADGVVDPHYVLLQSPDPLYPTPTAYVINANYYANNTATSKWISADAIQGYGINGLNAGDYTYRLTFSLANVDPATAIITGKWSCDDRCALYLNGALVAQNTAPNAWTALVPFTIAPGSGFISGQNNLDFVVTNGAPDRNPSGLLVDNLQGTASCTADAQCSGGQWCNNVSVSPSACQPRTVTGVLIPGGACNAALSARACVSQLCDSVTNLCADCTTTNTTACTASKPVCDTTAAVCAPCNTDALSIGSPPPNGQPALRCPETAPFCDVGAGTCSANCLEDSDCGAGKWCNNVSATPSACQPKVPNAQPVPGGTCTASLAVRACATGACDTNGDVCGIKLGDKTCASTEQCIDGTCLLTGTNTGMCAACATTADCALPKPICSTTRSVCVQCDAQNTTACAGESPVCDLASEACVPCSGDHGSNATAPCPSANAPVCTKSGSCTAAPLVVDAGPVDAAPPPAADAAVPADTGSLEGSGVGCATSPRARTPFTLAMLGFLYALGLTRRRSARRAPR